MVEWLVYAILGKLIITLWMAFHLPKWLTKFDFLVKLHACGLCSGVWIYGAMALIFGVDVLEPWFGFGRVFVVNEIITGMLTSWLVHVFSVGFSELYLNLIVE